MPRKAKRKAKMPTVSQRVKQDQTVKINIKNLLPPQLPPHMERSGDYIRPQRGMPTDKNLNMGNQTRLVGPSIQYAIRPPEFLPLPERFNSQGQPSYVREAPARVGRPDLITTETNPSDIAPSRAPIVALRPSGPDLTPAGKRYVESVTPAVPNMDMIRARYAAINAPQQDESEAAVAAASDQDVRDMRAIQSAMRRSEAAKRAWETRRMANPPGSSAATTGVPNVPSPIRANPRTPESPAVAADEYEDPKPFALEAGHPMSAQSRYGRR
jgi:hypothetical protein